MSTIQGSLYGEYPYDGPSSSDTLLYGAPKTSSLTIPSYSAAPFTATNDPANFYTVIDLSWSEPTNGYELRLVRNSFSVPSDQNDGINLAQGNYSTALPGQAQPNSYIDTGLSTASGGRWLYYSLFMLTSAGGYWVRSGDLQVMLPLNWGYGARMFSLLPGYYQDLDTGLIGS